MTEVYHTDLSEFILAYNVDCLEHALEKFTESLCLSPVDDDGTEPSLKVRVIGLLKSFPTLHDDYEIYSEAILPINSNCAEFRRMDVYLKSKRDLLCRVFEIKSVPIHWLDPSCWNTGIKRFTLSSKAKAVKEIKDMSADDILRLPLNQNMQSSWSTKFATVGDYIKAGRNQTKRYLDIFETNQEKRPLGYLIWAVGVTSVHVEQVN